MFPVDVDFRTTNTSISVIIEKIKNGSLDYIKFGTIDARLFDLCVSHLSLDPIIVRLIYLIMMILEFINQVGLFIEVMVYVKLLKLLLLKIILFMV